jgi:hypothetical protein
LLFEVKDRSIMLRQMEMKHEVDQLQAVIAMLAGMERMSVEQLLLWMEQLCPHLPYTADDPSSVGSIQVPFP